MHVPGIGRTQTKFHAPASSVSSSCASTVLTRAAADGPVGLATRPWPFTVHVCVMESYVPHQRTSSPGWTSSQVDQTSDAHGPGSVAVVGAAAKIETALLKPLSAADFARWRAASRLALRTLALEN